MNAFDIISEPARRTLLNHLRDGPQIVGDLVDASRLSQPLVSKHLRILREAGFVSMRPDGQTRIYELAAPGFEELEAWLAPYRAFWAERLDRLDAFLDETEENTP